MSQRTRRENVNVELIMNTSLDVQRSNQKRSSSPAKAETPIENEENSVNLLQQKKKMRQMKQEIQNVLDASPWAIMMLFRLMMNISTRKFAR